MLLRVSIIVRMKRVFAKVLPDVPVVPLLYPNVGREERRSILFLNNAFKTLTDPFVELTTSPEDADCIVLAHNYPSLRKDHIVHIEEQAALAKRLGKPFIVFWHGDSDSAVPYDHAVVFRTSQYRGFLRSNEVMMPAYAEDLLMGELCVRAKHDGKPVVGFCGWADYKNAKNRIATLLKNACISLGKLIGMRSLGARIKGITFRMQAIAHLRSSDLICTNFIIRKSYSGHASTITIEPETARKEYRENLLQSDYALVIKGDGNYSYRFYEALSLGRIPVLLDTDCVLPLSDRIHYDEFIVRIPYCDLCRMDRMIADHYAKISAQDFAVMQRKAREAFEKYLRVDRFLEYVITHIISQN